MKAKLKWWAALFIDHLFPRACWADISMWGMGYTDFADITWEAPNMTCREWPWCGKCMKRGYGMDKVDDRPPPF
jgi:hypothetical protein